jgi:predicted hydrocarbon binding protein
MQVILFTDVADTIGYGKYAGTYKIATEIRNQGYTCQVVDLFSFYSYSDLEKIVSKFCTSETVLVGFSCTLMEQRKEGKVFNFGRTDDEFHSIVSKIKSINNNTKICLGGARMTYNSYWHGVDYVIVNKGDVAILKLLKHLIDGEDIKTVKSTPCHVIDGNDYFYTQEQFAFSNIRYVPEDIIFPGESLPIEVARGCVFQCAFCHFDLIGKKVGDWQKTESALRDELIMNHEKFGTTHFMFTDELINESLPKMKLIHKVLTNLPFKISYTSYARLDLIWKFPEMREMLLESGAKSLAFGIETLNETAGKKIGKGLGEKRVKETLNYCAEIWKGKIITSSNFIVGLPGEDEASIRNTVEYLVSDDCPLDVFGFLPLYIRSEHDGRGSSKIDQDPKKFGYTIEAGKPWQGNDMNFQQALNLVQDIFTDKRVLTKSKFAAATWIGRIINLGYTVEDIFNIINDTSINSDTIDKKLRVESNIKKNWYFEQLMKI